MTAVLTVTLAAFLCFSTPVAASVWHKAHTVTWYGPGLWGQTTACGQTLTRKLVGVASLYKPCGTRVRFAWKGRSITLTVIDRTGGGKFDMTRRAMRLFIGSKPRTIHHVAWRTLP